MSPANKSLRMLIKQTQREAVKSWLRDKLKEYNARDHKSVNKHIDNLRDTLEQSEGDVIRPLFGGSVHKHTYVDGLSDVDVLMIINNSNLTSLPPRSVIKRMGKFIRRRLSKTRIRTGNLAVTVAYSDGIKIQLLPAIRRKDGIRIADPSKNRWSDVIHPERFAAKLTKVNQAKSGRVIPTIKLAKGLASRVIKKDGEKIQGYHMESIAIKAFRDYQGPTDLRSMLIHFCKSASEIVLEPIKDSTGQSLNVDDYMGDAKSHRRKRASKNFRRMLNSFSACKGGEDLDRLFGD